MPLFELHLIIENTPLGDAHLIRFCETARGDPTYINLRPTCAQTFYGKYPRQPMLTCKFIGDVEGALYIAGNLSRQMDQVGMNVIRVKVESMASDAPTTATLHHYFEFHCKVPITSTSQWDRVDKICRPYGAHLFFNSFSQSGRMQPVVTLRRYDTSLEDSMEELDTLLKELEENNFLYENLEREYSIYDSKVVLDEGWLFTGDPKNFIKSY